MTLLHSQIRHHLIYIAWGSCWFLCPAKTIEQHLQNDMWSQWRLRSSCTSTTTVKSNATVWMCRLISVFSGYPYLRGEKKESQSSFQTWGFSSCGKYCKNPKNLDTPKKCCNHPKILTTCLYHRIMHLKGVEGMANSVDFYQTALLGVVWTGSTMFAQTCPYKNLGSLR